MKQINNINGQIVDILNRRIYPGKIMIKNGSIHSIEETRNAYNHYILPGFIDAHIHIESSMLVPYEFAKIALCHGTVATVSDPHEIANVVGMQGVEYMIENSRNAYLKFHFGAPSCVPATSFETAGSVLDSSDVGHLLNNKEILYLSEMMNYPGVLNHDEEVMKKISIAKSLNKLVDGHAPGLKGEKARDYINAGISTDHECYSIEEAIDKLKFGMKIIIREGSAAKNFNALHPLIKEHADRLMFCSDDKHPDDLLLGHINELAARAVGLGYNLFDVLKMACVNPVEHYGLDVGLLRIGDPADFIVVESLDSFKPIKTVINGILIVEQNISYLPEHQHNIINYFNVREKSELDFRIVGNHLRIPVIEAIDGELITEKSYADLPKEGETVLPNPVQDILKISVVNRYKEAPVSSAFIRNFGFKNGAIASSVAHDSHNIVVVGSNDRDMCRAVNLIIRAKGGLSVVTDKVEKLLSLPIAGLMSNGTAEEVAKEYTEIDKIAKSMGCTLRSPFMTLSFMALLVIPKIKISDLGLFDAEKFEFI